MPVDHLQGHVASLYLEPDPLEPPFLCLLASGGHTLLLDVREHAARWPCSGRRSTTRPARRSTRARASSASATRAGPRSTGSRARATPRHPLPVARVPGLDFSFSGLKTALLYAVRELRRRCGGRRPRRELPAGDRARSSGGCARPQEQTGLERIAVVGGVAANSELRAALPDAAFAPLALCTDNAAMIASAAGSPTPSRIRLSWPRCLCLALSPASRVARLALVARLAASRSCSRRPAAPAARRTRRRSRGSGLVGSPRAEVAVGQRFLVVLDIPSLADKVAVAGGARPTGRSARGRAQALAAQNLFVSRMVVQGAQVQPDFKYTRVLNGFSALLDPRAVALLERAQEVVGVYPVRAAFPASVSSAVPSAARSARERAARPTTSRCPASTAAA